MAVEVNQQQEEILEIPGSLRGASKDLIISIESFIAGAS